jgi:hypothetical protein
VNMFCWLSELRVKYCRKGDWPRDGAKGRLMWLECSCTAKGDYYFGRRGETVAA